MITPRNRLMGMLWGAFIGDAIAMPAHGYMTQKSIFNEYGVISDYVRPKTPHPESITQHLSKIKLKPEYDYIGKRRPDWERFGTHPHATLRPGENTLPLYLAMHLMACIIENKEFDYVKWDERYRYIMISDGGHNDTFVPTVHRTYFENLNEGRDVEKNASSEARISDIVIFIPLMMLAYKDSVKTRKNITTCIKKFTIGESTLRSVLFVAEILVDILKGASLEDLIYNKLPHTNNHFALDFPYKHWIEISEDDNEMAKRIGRSANLTESLVLSLYIALKYKNKMEDALLVNTNIGGECTGRGALIGALLGGQLGTSGVPAKFAERLVYVQELSALIFEFANFMQER